MVRTQDKHTGDNEWMVFSFPDEIDDAVDSENQDRTSDADDELHKPPENPMIPAFESISETLGRMEVRVFKGSFKPMAKAGRSKQNREIEVRPSAGINKLSGPIRKASTKFYDGPSLAVRAVKSQRSHRENRRKSRSRCPCGDGENNIVNCQIT